MSDVRERLVEALRDEPIDPTDDMGGGYRLTGADAKNIADALLSLPGIAIVELPEPLEYDSAYECVGRWRVGELGAVVAYADGYIIDNTGGELGSADVCRQFAAALLAAANAAEQATP